jgi:hypothetical protein
MSAFFSVSVASLSARNGNDMLIQFVGAAGAAHHQQAASALSVQ